MYRKSLTYDDTRGKILYLLKTRGHLSVDNLAGELHQSGVNIRRHLDALERDALVCSVVRKCARGRPAHLFHLTERANDLFPQAYDVLSQDIFEQVEHCFGREAVYTVLQGRSEKIIRQIKPVLENKSFRTRVEEFSRIFNEMGYLMQVEHLADQKSRLMIHHCPVLRIAGPYPEVCDEDCRIGREVLKAHVVCECSLSKGSPCCRFWVTPQTKYLLFFQNRKKTPLSINTLPTEYPLVVHDWFPKICFFSQELLPCLHFLKFIPHTCGSSYTSPQ